MAIVLSLIVLTSNFESQYLNTRNSWTICGLDHLNSIHKAIHDILIKQKWSKNEQLELALYTRNARKYEKRTTVLQKISVEMLYDLIN